MKLKSFMILSLAACCVIGVCADEEIANRPVVYSSEDGVIYAKSIPAENSGQKGKTMLYRVGGESDTLVSEYNWYSRSLRLSTAGKGVLVRLGPWPRGQKPQEDHLALGLYRDGKVIREYSTLELEKLGSGVSASKSHYQIFKQQLGFRWLGGDTWVYEVEGISGKLFAFDTNTGAILEKAAGPAP